MPYLWLHQAGELMKDALSGEAELIRSSSQRGLGGGCNEWIMGEYDQTISRDQAGKDEGSDGWVGHQCPSLGQAGALIKGTGAIGRGVNIHNHKMAPTMH